MPEAKEERDDAETLEGLIRRSTKDKEIEDKNTGEVLLYNGKEACSLVMTRLMLAKLKVSVIETFAPGLSQWDLVYSSELHGFSLNTLMAKSQKEIDNGCFVLSVIEDGGTEEEYERVFGAVLFNRLEYRPGSYGSATTSLFRFKTPRRQNTENEINSILNVYHARTEENRFCIVARREYLAFGCSGGVFGLMLNKTLCGGESHTVDTFRNERLTHKEKFKIKQVELWHIEI